MYVALVLQNVPTLFGVVKAGTAHEIKKLPFKTIFGRLITNGIWIDFNGFSVRLQPHEFALLMVL